MQRINRLRTAQQLPNPILRIERGAAEGTMLPQPLCLKRVRPLLRRGGSRGRQQGVFCNLH